MSIAIQKKKFSKQEPVQYYNLISKFSKANPLHEQYLKILSDFETSFKKAAGQSSLKNLKSTLDSFYRAIKVDEFFLTDLSKHGDPASNTNENIILIHKAANIVSILADDLVVRRTLNVKPRRSFDFDFLDKNSSETKDITLLTVKILKLFSIINIHFANILANKTQFIIKMFELLLLDKKVYFKQVLSIIEAAIASNSEIVNNVIYPYMHEVLVHMPKKYIARFSRIIALIVLETTEKMEFKELSSNFAENKMIKVHSFLLSIPNLIETYAVILEHLREITERMLLTTPKTVKKSIRFLKETNLIKDSGLNLSFLKPLFEQAQISENLAKEIFTPKFIIKFIVKKSNLTEILFVISNLLSGKRKIEVQDRLAQINFINRVVHPMFDLLFHPDLEVEPVEGAEDCQASNPLATARIQLLRTIINFCDRDSPNTENKETLLSAEEQNILYCELIHGAFETSGIDTSKIPVGQLSGLSHLLNQISSQDGEILFTDENVMKNNAFEHVQKKGLLNKIITLFHSFHPNSNYRFWLASCVESFLRGFHEAHQVFVAHTGLLYNLVNQILNKQINKANNVQISYDLVGEIVKFNKYNMVMLEKMCEKFDWMKMLAEQALVNVVDSNVFLRALLLSAERFDFTSAKEKDIEMKEKLESFSKDSQLNLLFAKDSKKWFQLIVESIDPNMINQDNICCINTLLIVTIFADQKGELEDFVNALVEKEGRNRTQARELMKNLNNVLAVWHRYYISKTKDCFSLEYTSSISFCYFQQVKTKLQSLLDQKIKELELMNKIE